MYIKIKEHSPVDNDTIIDSCIKTLKERQREAQEKAKNNTVLNPENTETK